jgi:hypothetical protein
MRTVVEGLAGRAPEREIVRLTTMGDDTRLALLQNLNEALTFSLRTPEVKRLDFAVGFAGGEPAGGDSLRFLVMLEGQTDRVEFSRVYDLASDRNKWHELSLDIASVGGEVMRGAIGVVSSAQEAPSGITAAWSGLDLVFGDCPSEKTPQGFHIDLDGNREFVSLALRSKAREIPLMISMENGVRKLRWVGFPAHLPLRHLAVDLAPTTTDRILVESDSAFTLEGARTLHLGSVYPDYRLIHGSDMHIYENSAAVERGICLDRRAVGFTQSEGTPVLALAAMDDMGEARCGRSRIIAYEPERVEMQVTSEHDCFFLFQDMYYPGWKAYVDGERREFVRADVGFRVLEIEEGEHTVVMAFEPGSLKLGLALSILGLVLTLAYAWRTGPWQRDADPKGAHNPSEKGSPPTESIS